MTPLKTIDSKVIPLLEDRVDTDVIYPARFLLIMQRDALGRYLFHDRRFDDDGNVLPGSLFDDPRYESVQILLAGEDFGCGSSREQAVWTLYDYGIRCVIAQSFGEIFAANALRNGMLALQLPAETIRAIADAGHAHVDLAADTIAFGSTTLPLDLPTASRERLLGGWDEIEMIMRAEAEAIDDFEQRQRQSQPWLYENQA